MYVIYVRLQTFENFLGNSGVSNGALKCSTSKFVLVTAERSIEIKILQ